MTGCLRQHHRVRLVSAPGRRLHQRPHRPGGAARLVRLVDVAVRRRRVGPRGADPERDPRRLQRQRGQARPTRRPRFLVGELTRDVNGDGKADIVALDNRGQLWLYPSTGQAVNDLTSSAARCASAPAGAASATVRLRPHRRRQSRHPQPRHQGQLWLYPSTGQAVTDHVVSGAARIGTGWGGFNRLITADVTGDGKADIVTLDGKGQLWLYPSTGQAVTDHVVSGWSASAPAGAASGGSSPLMSPATAKPTSSRSMARASSGCTRRRDRP